jgi:crossover junction endodeoxyribonuclease RuvC
MKRILGVDPGLAETGFGVVEFSQSAARPLYADVIPTGANTPPGGRLSAIYTRILEVVDRFEPDEAGVESLYFTKNITSAIPVAQARGVVLLALHQRGVGTMEYTPQQIKQAIVGTGRAEKAQVQECVRLLLGLTDSPKPDHVADALAAAICHYHTVGTGWFAEQRRNVQ